jgi:hypothetical protein
LIAASFGRTFAINLFHERLREVSRPLPLLGNG